jgi:hypothetical protein
MSNAVAAMIHGYQYHFIHVPDYDDNARSIYWTKIPALASMLSSECRIAVLIDSDAIFKHLELPFEWLLNRWQLVPSSADSSSQNHTEGTSIAMALDNHWAQNEDSFGQLNINAGFIVAQNSPRTQEILRDWDSCPSNLTAYPDCDRFSSNWPAEQGAWGDFLRRQYKKDEDYIEIPCTEANGFEGMGTECFGVFISHYTIGKDLVKGRIAESLASSVMGLVQKELSRERDQVVVVRTNNTFGA